MKSAKAILTAISTIPASLTASYLAATQHPLFTVSLVALIITVLYAVREGAR